MAGIYLHIPYCKKACHYCNFHFSTSFRMRGEMADAMCREIGLQAGYLHGETIDTIYFGGGTPSAMPADDIFRLMDQIHAHFSVQSTPEVTLEANPDDISIVHLSSWKSAGINRISIGVQAFQDEILQAWNRSHDADQARACLGLALDAGFTYLTADLIYGDPRLTDQAWEQNIRILLEYEIPHISSYALTVEEKTALDYQIRKGQSKPLDEEQAARQYAMLQGILASEGFEQYEVSNFARPGYYSKHNCQYWSGTPYLGIGPSAHSFDGVSRQWNIAHNIRYIESLDAGNIPFEKEILHPRDIFNETIMTGMRTSSGIDVHRIEQLGEGYLNYLQSQLLPLLAEGKMEKTADGRMRLRPAYFFFADGLAASLFLTSDTVALS